jgi:putative phosphoribosyl transferase
MSGDGPSTASTAERSEAAEAVEIRSGSMLLSARWRRPANPRGAVVVAHCPACGEEAPLADALHALGYASLLPDLLLPAEANDPSRCHDAEFVSQRLRMAVRTVTARSDALGLPIAVLGRGCAGDAALVAAGIEPAIAAVVAIDPPLLLPEPFLERVEAAALVIAGPGDLGTPRGRAAIDALRRRGGAEVIEMSSGASRGAELPTRVVQWLDGVAARGSG